MTETEKEQLPPEQPPIEEVIDYKDKYLRMLAETDNTRRRMQKEKQDMMRFSTDMILSEILAPIDQMENALKFADQMSPDVKNWALGFQMILNQFKEVLASNGVTSFNSVGEFFDPAKHEAVETEETDAVPIGTITQEFVKGYKSGDRILRPAKVKVNKEKKNESEETK